MVRACCIFVGAQWRLVVEGERRPADRAYRVCARSICSRNCIKLVRLGWGSGCRMRVAAAWPGDVGLFAPAARQHSWFRHKWVALTVTTLGGLKSIHVWPAVSAAYMGRDAYGWMCNPRIGFGRCERTVTVWLWMCTYSSSRLGVISNDLLYRAVMLL